jgi:HKD family nuclease
MEHSQKKELLLWLVEHGFPTTYAGYRKDLGSASWPEKMISLQNHLRHYPDFSFKYWRGYPALLRTLKSPEWKQKVLRGIIDIRGEYSRNGDKASKSFLTDIFKQIYPLIPEYSRAFALLKSCDDFLSGNQTQRFLKTLNRISWILFHENYQETGSPLEFFYNSPPMDGTLKWKLLEFLEKVRTLKSPSLCIAAYQLSETDIVGRILDLADLAGGEQIKIFLDGDNIDSESDIYKSFQEKGIQLVTDKDFAHSGRGQSHNKFMLAGDSYLWTGSVNFTRSDLLLNWNHAWRFKSSQLCEIFQNEFNALLSGGSQRLEKNPVPPQDVFVDGVRIRVRFSPQHRVVNELIRELKAADYSALGAAFFLTDSRVLNALSYLHRKGVQVHLHLDELGAGSKMSGKKRVPVKDFLSQNGIFWSSDGTRRLMHNKLFLVDAKTDSAPVVISGSANFTRSANIKNDENLMFIYSSSIAKEVLGYYKKIASLDEVNQTPLSLEPEPYSYFYRIDTSDGILRLYSNSKSSEFSAVRDHRYPLDWEEHGLYRVIQVPCSEIHCNTVISASHGGSPFEKAVLVTAGHCKRTLSGASLETVAEGLWRECRGIAGGCGLFVSENMAPLCSQNGVDWDICKTLPH